MNLEKKLTKHFVNGDEKTNYLEDIIYVFFFILEIFKEKRTTQNKLFFDDYKNFYDLKFNKENLLKLAPSRILCEFFLLGWLKKNFNPDSKVNILDVVCGNTTALRVFKKYFKKFNYFGCDLNERENWKDLKKNGLNLFKYEIGKKFEKDLPKIDIIHSQSVFEHVKYDLSGFKILAENFKETKQIHFLPAPISFLNYEKHGYRRYSYKDLLKLKKILPGDKMEIYSIGGTRALKYHFNFLLNNKFKKNFKLTKFLKCKNTFNKSFDLLRFLISDNSKSLPVFYAIEF